jgi:hypothetical protein
MPVRTLIRVLIIAAASAVAAACVPIGVKGTSLPYADSAAPALSTPSG